MFKKVKRKSENSRSWSCLATRVRYIIDQMHPHHKVKKVVQAAINFGCLWGQTAKDFIQAVHESQELWKIRNKKGKGGGNPTEDIFFELIYSAPKGLRTNLEQRTAIDRIIIEPFRNCPIRRNWHLAAWDLAEAERPENWKDIDDGHYLFSARDNFGNATISSRFGNGKETFESWMRRVDQEICDMLNQSREVPYEPVHGIHRRRLGEKLGIKLTKLCEIIGHHTSEPVRRDNVVEIIKGLGHHAVPIKDRDKLVKVTFHGRQKPRKYRIKKLLLDISETQLEIELARPDGNDGEEGGAGGESGGGTGGLGAVAPAAAQPGAGSALEPDHPTSGKVSKTVTVPSASPTLVSASAETVKPFVASAAPPLSAKPDSAQSAAKPASADVGGIDPGIAGTGAAASDPDADEPAKPQAASAQSAHAVEPAGQPEPMPARKKPRWRLKPQPKKKDGEQEK